jgi:glycosyltransferase involved in cell wall biosynthesis
MAVELAKKHKRRKRVSIVIPAHNEERGIEETVIEIADNFRSAEIIVVCNGCSDKTYAAARKIKRPNVEVLNFHERIGKGGAIIEGFKVASGDVVGFVDADGSFRAEDIQKIIDGTKKHGAAIASKWKGKDFFEVQSRLSRKIGSRGWNLLSGLIADLDLSDTQAGLKFFRRDVLDKVLDKGFVCRGFDFDVELLYRVKKAGFKIKETYVPIRDGGKSTFDMRNSPKMFVNLMRFHFSKDEE